MLDSYFRARDHVERHGWDALRRITFGAVAFTALAVAVSGLWAPLFYASAFIAMVAWFVALGLLVFNAEEATARRRRRARGLDDEA